MTSELVSDADAALIERACSRVVIEAVGANDRGDFETFASWFTPDGVLRRPSGDVLEGRRAIIDGYRGRPTRRITRHVVSNIRILIRTRESAEGRSYVVLYTADADGAPDRHFGVPADPRVLVGELDDRFVLTEEGWRIAERRARFLMHGD